MIKIYLLVLACVSARPAFADSLRERVVDLLPEASLHFTRAANDLETSVRELARGRDWIRASRVQHDYATFVYNLRRETGDVATQAAVMVRFAEFCRAETPAQLGEIVEALSSVAHYHARLRGAHRLPRRNVDLRVGDVLVGVTQATLGTALTIATVPLIPFALLAPLIPNDSGSVSTISLDENGWTSIFSWVASSARLAANGVARTAGAVPAKTMLKSADPRAKLVRLTCQHLLK